MKELVHYWQTDYDGWKAEAKLNALTPFMTTIDGLDIQFIHVRSRYPNALALIMTHGWPSSIFGISDTQGLAARSGAQGVGATDRLWEVSDLVALREASERRFERAA
jgi:hypothetical protein